VSSRRYPRWATAHHETTRWFAERYNTVTTQSTVPNKSGVWRGRCCCCIVEVVLWRRGGGGGDDDAIAYKRAPEPHRCRNTHTQTHVHYTRTHARAQARTHARKQARTHTSTHAYSEPLRAAFGSAGARGKGYTPTVPKTTHDTPMTGACSPSFGAVGVHPSPGRSLALPFCSLADQSTSWNPSSSMWAPFNKKRNQSDLPLCLVTLVQKCPEVGPLGEKFCLYYSPYPSSSSSKDPRRRRAPLSLGKKCAV
jgi:hypothetical protein